MIDGAVRLRTFASVAGVAVASTNDSGRATWRDPTGAEAHVWYAASPPSWLHRAVAPAPPGQGETRRHWLRTRGHRARVVGVWSWPSTRHPTGVVHDATLTLDGSARVHVTLVSGETHVHELVDGAWHVQCQRKSGTVAHVLPLSSGLHARSARDSQSVDTTGETSSAPHLAPERGDAAEIVVPRRPAAGREPASDLPGDEIPGAHSVMLGETHYVGTELPWCDAGRPSARVQLAVLDGVFVADVAVFTGAPVVPPEPAENPLDNEPNDVNADGVQWYVGGPPRAGQPLEWHAAGLVVPLPAAPDPFACRHTRVTGSGSMPSARWHRLADGWAMRLTWDLDGLPISDAGALRFELVVNERPPQRERRRGQLVLSGGGGFGYLAGPRRPADRFVLLTFVPPHGKTTSR